MKKRLLAGLLAVCMVVTMLPAPAFGVESDFTIENGILKKYRGSDTNVVIPDAVVTIGPSAFSVCKSMTSVDIPDSVITIENGAFSSCSNLASVVIPDSVTSIAQSAFANCTSLTDVTISDNITSLGLNAFDGTPWFTNLKTSSSDFVIAGKVLIKYQGREQNVSIPTTVSCIADNAFFSNVYLESVSIPGDVISIGNYAFCGCNYLTTVGLSSGLSVIGEHAFDGCERLPGILIPDSVIEIGDTAFGSCEALTDLTISNSIKEIGVSVFGGCRSLKNVEIPTSVTSIGSGAFGGCWALEGITIPSSVTNIADGAFSECYELTSVIIPDSVTNMGDDVFENCTGLSSITIGNNVVEIGEWAFHDCTSLINVTIGNRVSQIGSYAFYNCTNLTRMTIPSNVARIGRFAFAGCTKLTAVAIPGGISEFAFNDDAFQSCTELKDIYYGGTEEEWAKYYISSDSPLKKAVIHYNSTGGIPPEEPGDDYDGVELKLVSSIPTSGAIVNQNDELTLTFNRPFTWTDIFPSNRPSGSIRIVNYATNETAIEIADRYTLSTYLGEVSHQSLVIKCLLSQLKPGKYYLLIDGGVISALNSDGTRNDFAGISGRNGLTFTIVDKMPSITVEMPIGNGNIRENVEWNDEWFQNPSSTYIHKLAVVSAALSNLAYSFHDVKQALVGMHFNEEDCVSIDYDWSMSTNGRAGYTLAHKPITISGQPYTLVAIVVRGSSNASDWASNFLDSGMFDGDSGFEDAAQSIISELEKYCSRCNINPKGNVKFLVTGHSRGGIIANLIAAELSGGRVLDHPTWDCNFGPSKVFAYTFASPRLAAGATRVDLDNIFNIINYRDPVPRVPLTNYARYGIDLYLPWKRYCSSYKDDVLKPEEKYELLQGEKFSPSSVPIVLPVSLPVAFEYHSSVLYYCWLSCYDADSLFSGNEAYKQLRTACPVDVYVYNEAGVLAASIINDVVVVDDLEAEVVVEKSTTGAQEKVKIVYLPTDQTYSVRIEAIGEGIVSYTVREMDVPGASGMSESEFQIQSVSDRVLRTVSFDKIDIVQNDVLTGKVDDPFSIPANDYALTKNGKDVIYPTSDSAGPIAPTDLTWGKFLYQGTQIELPGAISCKTNSEEDRTFIQVYRKNDSGPDECVYALSMPPAKVENEYMIISDSLAHIDPYLFEKYSNELETGVYYFTACMEENGAPSTNVATSGDWSYTKPSDRLIIPETVQSSLALNGRTVTWNAFPKTDQALAYSVALLYSEQPISDPALTDLQPITSYVIYDLASTECVFPERVFNKSGYYYASIRVISKDITQNLSSHWSTPSPAHYYNASVSPGTPSTPSDPSYDYIPSGGGLAVSRSYTITVQSPILNGKAEPSRTSAAKGNKVMITVTPDGDYKLETLVIKDANGNTVNINAADNNRYEFIMPGSNVTVNATFIYSEQFTDVAKDAFYYDAVLWATKNSITNGTGTYTFSPTNPCTRGEIVTFLWRANGSPKVSGNNIFVDVDPNAFFYDAILWAVSNGITNGTGANTFSPYATCTRGEAVTFLHRSKGAPTVSGNTFIDVSSTAFYADAVSWAVSSGVTNGTGTNTFGPNNICTRGEIVTFLYRAN